MAKYPIRVLLDENKQPFIPFIPSNAIPVNGTDKLLDEILAGFVSIDVLESYATKQELLESEGRITATFTAADDRVTEECKAYTDTKFAELETLINEVDAIQETIINGGA